MKVIIKNMIVALMAMFLLLIPVFTLLTAELAVF